MNALFSFFETGLRILVFKLHEQTYTATCIFDLHWVS